MIRSRARNVLTSLVILVGMTAGAAPIHAQDVAPPRDTEASSGGTWNVTTPTTTPTTTTTAPPRVQSPTTTTTPSTPPPTTTIPDPPRTTVPETTQPQQEPTTTLPLQPPSKGGDPQEAPPSLPPDPPTTLPEDYCTQYPKMCEKDVIPPVSFPPVPKSADLPDPPLTLPSDVAADGAGAASPRSAVGSGRTMWAVLRTAVRDGVRIHRQAKLMELAETGASCLTFDCVNEIRALCASVEQNASWVEMEDGGWDVFCWEGDMPTQLDVMLDTTPAGGGNGFGQSCFLPSCTDVFVQYCWSLGGTVGEFNDVEGGYEIWCDLGERAAAHEGLSLAAPVREQGDDGMSCMTIECAADYILWCYDSGGDVEPILKYEEGFEITCSFPNRAEGDTLTVATPGERGEGDDSDLICWEGEDGKVHCMELTIDNCVGEICDNERGPIRLDISRPQQSGATLDLGISNGQEPLADAGMTCLGGSLDCAKFIGFCDDMGGTLDDAHVGGGWHELTCHLSDGNGGHANSTTGPSRALLYH